MRNLYVRVSVSLLGSVMFLGLLYRAAYWLLDWYESGVPFTEIIGAEG